MRLNIGLIGLGFIGRLHVEAVRRLGYAEVVAIAASNQERAKIHAQEMGIRTAYGDYRRLLEDPRIDIVHITTPNFLHYQQARDSIHAGKHVICEKPLAITSKQTKELAALAEASGLICSTVFNFRYFPLVQQARYMIQSSQELGRIYAIHGYFLQDWLLFQNDYNWRNDPSQGGAFQVLSTIGCHWLDLAQFISGSRIEEVAADFSTFVPIRLRTDRGVPVKYRVTGEDHVHSLLRFSNGAKGAVVFSNVSAGHRLALQIEISGSQSALCWNSERPNGMWWGHRDKGNVIIPRDPELMAPPAARFARFPGGHNEGYADTFRAYIEAVYQRILSGRAEIDGEPPIPTFEDGHCVQCLSEAMGKSAQVGTWVKINEIGVCPEDSLAKKARGEDEQCKVQKRSIR